MVGLAHRENPRKPAPYHAGRDRETHRRIGFARGNGLKHSDLSTAGRQPVHGRKTICPRPGVFRRSGFSKPFGAETPYRSRPGLCPDGKTPRCEAGCLTIVSESKMPRRRALCGGKSGTGQRRKRHNRISGHERPGATRRLHPPLLKTAWYRRGSRAAYPCVRSIAGGNPRRARNGPQG